MCNTERESMGTPEQIKAMTSSHGKEQGVGWRGVGGEGEGEGKDEGTHSHPFCLSGPILWNG